MSGKSDNRVAIVTASARGIGAACALAMAQSGLNVLVSYTSREAEAGETVEACRRLDVEADAERCDITSDDQCRKLVDSALARWGRIDVLINNAVTSTSAPFDELTDDEFRYHIDVKLMAYIRVARLVLPHLAKQAHGRIINIGGMTARVVAPLRMTNGVVNAGVANFTKQFAGYAARRNVTVNCIHPGYTATERVMQIFEREARETDSELKQVIARYPMSDEASIAESKLSQWQ